MKTTWTLTSIVVEAQNQNGQNRLSCGKSMIATANNVIHYIFCLVSHSVSFNPVKIIEIK